MISRRIANLVLVLGRILFMCSLLADHNNASSFISGDIDVAGHTVVVSLLHELPPVPGNALMRLCRSHVSPSSTPLFIFRDGYSRCFVAPDKDVDETADAAGKQESC